MRVWYSRDDEATRRLVDIAKDRIQLGSADSNDLVLTHPYVASEAALLRRRNGVWEIFNLGVETIKVGEKELYCGASSTVTAEQLVSIPPFCLQFELPRPTVDSADERRRLLDDQLSRFVEKIHLGVLEFVIKSLGAVDPVSLTVEQVLAVEERIELIAREAGYLATKSRNLVNHAASHVARNELLRQLSTTGDKPSPTGLLREEGWARMRTAVPERDEELQVHLKALSRMLDLNSAKTARERVLLVERSFLSAWERSVSKLHNELLDYLALRYIKKDVKDILFGYGPLEDLLRLPTISEIMVVDRDHIYVEREGLVESSGRRFVSDDVTISIIGRIVARVGRRIDKASPLVDARLSDGSRVNAVIPPLAVSGPCLTIRKFPERRMSVGDLIARGALTKSVDEFLRAAVISRRNILISGGTGTGKTTLLNCLSEHIPENERIVTVEDTAELQLKREHVVRLEAKSANVEGAGAYTIRDLVKNALRMRPDRIVVGECRGPEALDMLQAMNTGHDGSLTTIHANSARDVILRLEVLVQMAADLPIASIRQQIVAAIDLIVQLQRMRDGRRCVTQVTEVVEVEPRSGEIRTKDLFAMDAGDETAVLTPTGHLPTFLSELVAHNVIKLDQFYL